MGAVVALVVLATWCAECAWGGFTVVEYPAVLLFLGPLYGGAAVVIREVARRRGVGWPGIVLMAAAFGVVQAGLVDQSLFDREALADTAFAQWSRQAQATVVLGVSAEQVFDFVGGHVWLSICAPVAVVEAWVAPARRTAPWLGRGGLVVAGALYVGGSVLIWSDSGRVASGVQIAVVVLAAAVLVAVALLPRGQRGPQVPRTAAPKVAGIRVAAPAVGALVLAAHVASWFYGPSWWGVGLRVVTVAVVATVVVRWVATARHVVAAWGGCLLAAAGAAYLAPPYTPADPRLMLFSDVVGSLIAVGVVVGAYLRAGRSGRPAVPLRRG